MMTGKVESLYDLVFDQMVRKLNTLIPGDNTSVRLMVSDFEFAIINSSKRGRDSCSTRKSQGSWFHFGQVFFAFIPIYLYAIMILTISFLILYNLWSGVQ